MAAKYRLTRKGANRLDVVMRYQKTPFTRRLARWANRRWLYWSCDFAEYMPEVIA